MSINNVPASERVHISFFGKRNAGKSSLINAVTGQKLSIVSDVKGTTTDPVKKTMELLPIGPVVVIDTPGIDDEGELGALRVQKTYDIMAMTDVAVLVVDSQEGMDKTDRELQKNLEEKNIPYVIAFNKWDIQKQDRPLSENEIYVSAVDNININDLKELIAKKAKKQENPKTIIGEFIGQGDFVVLVTPIDEAAPKGRLILPQQQTIREILDFHAKAVVVQPKELKETLESLKGAVKAVVTDSQVFGLIEKDVPKDILLTSFSILFARYKGDLRQNTRGAKTLDNLEEGSKILISEGCTHHRQCGDIGTVKLPKLIEKYTGKKMTFSWTSGTEFPKDLREYDLVIHCGACMLNEREMKSRLSLAEIQGIPMTNYGIAIAKMNGILDRSLEIFDGNY